MQQTHFYVGGEWIAPATDRQFTIICAATEEPLAQVPEGSEADMDRAVAAARAAFDQSGWPQWPAAERAAVMLRFADALEKRAAEMARLISQQNGMPLFYSENFEAGFSLGLLRYYASLATQLDTVDRRTAAPFDTLVRREALGVVAAIVPWNFPAALAFSKIAPAMLAGCTLVIKPSPTTVLDSYVLAQAANDAQVPAGVLNWVAADRAVGAYLVAHPGVDKVAFTGSTAAGRAIAKVCGELLRPVTLELGGKSAAIILDDADLTQVMQGLQLASFFNNGQACIAGTRVLAPRKRYRETVDALAAMAESLLVGDPLDRGVQVGPMASSVQRERVERYIGIGKTEARLVAGGGRPKQDRGWFVQPTVFADVHNDAVIAREEIFGPVLAVIPYEDDADAVRIANDSRYGLGGSVWTADRERGIDVAQRVKTGSIGVNGYNIAIGAPFGGVKDSGLGRELGPEAVNSYLQYKSIYLS